MKYFYITLLLSFMFFMPSCLNAQEPVQDPCGMFDPKWQACSQDSDCVREHDFCGVPKAYNKEAFSAVDQYNKCMGPVVSCPTPEADNFHSMATCVAGVCDLIIQRFDAEH